MSALPPKADITEHAKNFVRRPQLWRAEVLDYGRLRALLAPPCPTLARRCRTARPTGFCLGASAQAPMIGTAAIRQSLPLARMARTGAGVAGDRVEPHGYLPPLSLSSLEPHDARVRTGVETRLRLTPNSQPMTRAHARAYWCRNSPQIDAKLAADDARVRAYCEQTSAPASRAYRVHADPIQGRRSC